MSTVPTEVGAGARPDQPAGQRPWGLACLLLALAGVFFFSSYGFANWLASQRANVPAVYFEWERGIPFLPWTILPYWSIDLLYGISFFLWRTRAALLTHVKRLVLAQLVSVACFIAFPLRFSFARPEADGLPGQLFTLLGGFDLPFNQAPSLHISLLVILWVAFAAQLRSGWRWLLHGWFALIGVSVLTTWQHHLIDVPTGALAGWLCVYLFPMQLPAAAAGAPDARTRQLSRRYTVGALVALLCAVLAVGASVTLAFLLLWAALALACVARIYALAARRGSRRPRRFDGAGRALGAGALPAGCIPQFALVDAARAAAQRHRRRHLGWPLPDPRRTTRDRGGRGTRPDG